MKKVICFVLPLLALTLYGEETIHLWSGRLVTLPGNGSWQICAEHGRILASGNGDVRVELPPLEPGTALDADLIRNGKKRKLRFHSQKCFTDMLQQWIILCRIPFRCTNLAAASSQNHQS